jgi:hypothetical protein
VIRNFSKQTARGVSQIALQDFERLPAGVYMLEIIDERSATKTVQKFIKN